MDDDQPQSKEDGRATGNGSDLIMTLTAPREQNIVLRVHQIYVKILGLHFEASAFYSNITAMF